MIDLFAPLETVPVDGGRPRGIRRDHRCWPNQVSGEYCAHIDAGDGGREEEHWYDDEGKPLDPRSPEIRNVPAKPRKASRDELLTAFTAGAGVSAPDETARRFELWYDRLDKAA
jgi:hypothetical protein